MRDNVKIDRNFKSVTEICFETNRESFFLDLQKQIQLLKYKHVYLFTIWKCSYPISFFWKKFGLWNNFHKAYGINIFNQEEAFNDGNLFRIYYGLAEIKKQDFNQTISYLDNDSFIIISDNIYMLNEIKKSIVVKNDYIFIDDDILNSILCLKGGLFIKKIIGNNGVTISIYRF